MGDVVDIDYTRMPLNAWTMVYASPETKVNLQVRKCPVCERNAVMAGGIARHKEGKGVIVDSCELPEGAS